MVPELITKSYHQRILIRSLITGKSYAECRREIRKERQERIKTRVIELINNLGFRQKKTLKMLLAPSTFYYNTIYIRNPLIPSEAKEVVDIAIRYRDIIIKEDLLKQL